jgi:radical SAM protein with 4Fe4S-binding SPASM domain
MSQRNVPINKGNYSMDTPEREARFEEYRGEGWEREYADYRKKWVELARTQTVSEYPLLVDIELASICNLRCPMCYTITDEFKQHVNVTRMDWELYKKIIDEIGGKVTAIRLSLRGEATLHTKFIEAIKYAKDHGIREVSTLTHGGKLTLPYFEKMVEAGIDWITVSADGVGATYERVRKPLKFNDLLDKLKAIKQYKEEHQLKRPVIKVQGIWPGIVESGPDLYYDTFKACTDLVAFNPLIDYLSNDTHIEYLEEFTCPQQYQRLVIGADGLVMKCSNDEENREVIGDIRQETVHQVWHGEKMQAVRNMHLQPRGFMQSAVCRKCYLPRKTEDEEAQVGVRTFIVRNYVHRIQLIGK